MPSAWPGRFPCHGERCVRLRIGTLLAGSASAWPPPAAVYVGVRCDPAIAMTDHGRHGRRHRRTAPVHRGPAASWARRLLGALVTGAAAVSALIACGGSSEGTVVAKTDQGVYDIGCQAGSTITGPVALPVWGACSVPACWRLVVRDSDGNTARALREPRGVRPHAIGCVLARADRLVSYPASLSWSRCSRSAWHWPQTRPVADHGASTSRVKYRGQSRRITFGPRLVELTSHPFVAL